MRYFIRLVLMSALGVMGCSETVEGTNLCESVTCEDDGNECTGTGICDPADGTCDYPLVEDGTECGAGPGTCQAGVCVGGVFPCDEQGIREAIEVGGGPHTFACAGPTVVVTDAEIAITNPVVLDGQSNLTVDGAETHGVLYVPEDVVSEVRGLTVRGGLRY